VEPDPFERARARDDFQSIQRWEDFKESLDHGYAVTLSPSCFFGIMDSSEPEAANQRDLDLSREMLLAAYTSAFQAVIPQVPASLELKIQPYSPPGAYERGGGVSGIWEVLTAVQLSGAVDLAKDVATNLIADWITGSIKTLREAMDRAGILVFRRRLPSHHPFIVRVACESHALRSYPELVPMAGHILEPSHRSADYPDMDIILTILVSTKTGGIVYVVNSRLEPLSLLKVTPNDIRLLSTVSWNDLFSPQSVDARRDLDCTQLTEPPSKSTPRRHVIVFELDRRQIAET
jgi:hypothetical protein